MPNPNYETIYLTLNLDEPYRNRATCIECGSYVPVEHRDIIEVIRSRLDYDSEIELNKLSRLDKLFDGWWSTEETLCAYCVQAALYMIDIPLLYFMLEPLVVPCRHAYLASVDAQQQRRINPNYPIP